MACKKSELVAVINSYATARASGDGILIQSAASMLQGLLDSLEYVPEELVEKAEEGEELEGVG
jgi:hypothetical protein